MIGAVFWKEWREQRWRCVLAVLVLVTIAASLVRAQLVPTPEAILLVFGPLGLLLAILLAMGSVATERADGTWEFLTAQPMSRATLLRLKWLVGAGSLLAAILLAGIAAHLAAVSRGVFDIPAMPHYVAVTFPNVLSIEDTAGWLWLCVARSAAALLAWYTVLFFLLTRARNELHAGLGGVLLTLAVLAWAMQYPMSVSTAEPSRAAITSAFWVSALLNPLSPLLFVFEPSAFQFMAAGVALLLWTVGPLWLVGQRLRSGRPR